MIYYKPFPDTCIKYGHVDIEAEKAISRGAGEERGWKRSLPGGFTRNIGWSVEQVRRVLLDSGADVFAVDKTSRYGMWLDT